jgi:hypothetical protein
MSENPPAFPVSDGIDVNFGMTLRDWFAGQALAWLPHVGCGADLDNRDTATAAYQLADALLAERERKP